MNFKAKECHEKTGKFFEAQKSDDGKVKFPVIIISQGLGNLGDRNYYTASAVQSGVKVYEGKKAYFDHPTKTENEEQPGRSVHQTCGHYEQCKAELDSNGVMVLKAMFIPEMGSPVIGKLMHAIEYKKTFPKQDYIGISINGDGIGETCDYEEFINKWKPTPFEMEKIKQIEGQSINAITELTAAVSADLVTEAGARGQFLTESKKLKQTRRQKMFESVKKLLGAIQKGDKKQLEEAVKLLQEDSDKEKKESDAKEKSEGKGAKLAKAFAAAKKEMKKEDGESEEAYEAKCMQAAMEKMEAADEGEKKDDEKKEGDPPSKKSDDDADDKKEGEGDKKDEKKEGDDADKKDDKKSDDKKDDPIAAMKKELEAMSEKLEKMEAAKNEAEKNESKASTESATIKIALETKARAELVDRVLAESGLKRRVTDEIRALVEKCKTEKEMKELVSGISEAADKVVESYFMGHGSAGLVEREASSDNSSNDHLF